MILYIDATGKYVAKQDEAKKAGKGWHQVEVPTTDGRQALADYLNAVRWSEQQQNSPVVTVETEKEWVEWLMSEDDPRPATTSQFMTQEQVDAMFEDKADKPLPDLDAVCAAIAEMRGAPIGHVAHELAARIENLAKEEVEHE